MALYEAQLFGGPADGLQVEVKKLDPELIICRYEDPELIETDQGMVYLMFEAAKYTLDAETGNYYYKGGESS